MSASPDHLIVVLGVDLDTQMAQPLGGGGADNRRTLADAAGEHERVEPARCGGHRADPGNQAMDEHVECHRRRLIASGRARLYLSHVGGAGQRQQPGPVFEGIRHGTG